MLEVPWKCTILCFLLANCYGINQCNVFIGQYNQNDRNSFERCALSGPQKHITKESDGFHNHSTQLTMVLHHLCPEHELLTGTWNLLISGQIVNSFGPGMCTFDRQSSNLRNYASGDHVSTSSCMLRIEILITFNVTCMWTFHTNSLLHEYLFLMHVHKYKL